MEFDAFSFALLRLAWSHWSRLNEELFEDAGDQPVFRSLADIEAALKGRERQGTMASAMRVQGWHPVPRSRHGQYFNLRARVEPWEQSLS